MPRQQSWLVVTGVVVVCLLIISLCPLTQQSNREEAGSAFRFVRRYVQTWNRRETKGLLAMFSDQGLGQFLARRCAIAFESLPTPKKLSAFVSANQKRVIVIIREPKVQAPLSVCCPNETGELQCYPKKVEASLVFVLKKDAGRFRIAEFFAGLPELNPFLDGLKKGTIEVKG